jgi:hypothetical protein
VCCEGWRLFWRPIKLICLYLLFFFCFLVTFTELFRHTTEMKYHNQHNDPRKTEDKLLGLTVTRSLPRTVADTRNYSEFCILWYTCSWRQPEVQFKTNTNSSNHNFLFVCSLNNFLCTEISSILDAPQTYFMETLLPPWVTHLRCEVNHAKKVHRSNGSEIGMVLNLTPRT